MMTSLLHPRCLIAGRAQPIYSSPASTRHSVFALPLVLVGYNAFTTSARAAAAPVKASSSGGQAPSRGVKALRIKKRAIQVRSKRPEPGERNAAKRRVVLSNPNALDVPDVQEMNAENVGDSNTLGNIMTFPATLVNQLRAVEAFKTSQNWMMFRKPAVLMRKEAIDLGQTVARISADKESCLRAVVTGSHGAGKSVLLLQAMAMAFLKKWVVINIPEGQDLTNGQTSYIPLANSIPTTYIQRHYLSHLLSTISSANSAVLSSFPFILPNNLPSHLSLPVNCLPADASLKSLAELGSHDPDLAYVCFTLLLKALLTTNTANAPHMPPVLLAVDGLEHIMKPETAYYTSDFQHIHAHSLHLVNWIVSFLHAPPEALPNGGIVIAATSTSNRPNLPTFEKTLQIREARLNSGQTRPEFPSHPPFEKPDLQVMHSLDGVSSIMRLGGLPKLEARNLIEYFARSGLLKRRVDRLALNNFWSCSGGGVPGRLTDVVLNRLRD